MISTKFLLALLASIGSSFAGTPLTPGSGEWNVSVSHVGYEDGDRKDPYDSSQNRKIMTSLFYPIHHRNCTAYCNEPYMPDETAKVSNEQFFGNRSANVFENIQLKTCCGSNIILDPANYTIVVLEPAYGTSRFLYSGIAQEIASHGFAVVTIDHPHDASVVEYNSTTAGQATTIYSKKDLDPFTPINPLNDTVSDILNTRVVDINFVLGQLSHQAATDSYLPVTQYLTYRPFNTSNIGIIGHGIGGTVATHLSFINNQYKISVNFAGPGAPTEEDISVPYIVFMGRHPGGRREDDVQWPDTWKHLTGQVTELDMQNATIFDYSDLPIIADLSKKASAVKGLGTIANWKAYGITAQFARAWMSRQFGPSRSNKNEIHDLVNYFVDDIVPYPGVGTQGIDDLYVAE